MFLVRKKEFDGQKVKYLICFLVLLAVGCKEKGNYPAKTEVFQVYLQQQFEEQIPEEKHFYFVSNSIVCYNCVVSLLNVLNNEIEDANAAITIVTALDLPNEEQLSRKFSLKKDLDKNLNNENLDLNNLTLFCTEHHYITEIHDFTGDGGIEELRRFIDLNLKVVH